MEPTTARPVLRAVTLDCMDARRLAEFYRELLGLTYVPGDEPPPPGEHDPNGHDWLMLDFPEGGPRLAFQQVASLPAATWPDGPVPQQLHLELAVRSREELDAEHGRVLGLGARLLRERFDDPPEEPLRVYADPAGHPFCLFVSQQLAAASAAASASGSASG